MFLSKKMFVRRDFEIVSLARVVRHWSLESILEFS
jgi:hypothetical protein